MSRLRAAVLGVAAVAATVAAPADAVVVYRCAFTYYNGTWGALTAGPIVVAGSSEVTTYCDWHVPGYLPLSMSQTHPGPVGAYAGVYSTFQIPAGLTVTLCTRTVSQPGNVPASWGCTWFVTR